MSRSLSKQPQLRPLDVAQRTRGPSRRHLTAPVADPIKPGKENPSQPSNKDAIASANKPLPLSLPKRHSPAVEEWLNPSQKAEAWLHLSSAAHASTPATGERDRHNLREKTYSSEWHPASQNNSYSNVATVDQSSGPTQGSEAQGHFFSGEMGTATFGSLYQSQSARRDHDLLCIGHLFTERGVPRQHGGEERKE